MIGRTIGHYQILEKLGQGGMGVVYKARDTRLHRLVALKFLPPEWVADSERERRFVQEAKAASALNHPNIITIYDISSDKGVDFIAMEYVPGKTLEQLIGRKGLQLNQTLKYAVQIADALTRAHTAGIVHRDLKPGNVMVDEHELVKVLDFGLAKLTATAAPSEDEPTRTLKPATEEGTIVGTVAYMSPEQVQGKPVDARSDIFSLGTVLYEMLTGRRPFQGDTKLSTLAAIMHKEPAPLGTQVPHDLQRLIMRCLRKDPARRFQHMDDVKVALEELKDESDSGTLASRAGLQPARPKRKRVLARATVVALLAAAGAAWYWLRPAPEAAARLKVVPLTSFPGREQDPALSPDGNHVAYIWNGEKQDNYDIYVGLVGAGRPLRLTTNRSVDHSPAWSPDRMSIAFVRNLGGGKSGIFVIPALGGAERQVAEIQGERVEWWPRRYLDWSPDGKWLAASDGRSLVLVSVESGEKRKLTLPPERETDHDPAFAENGRALAFVRRISLAVSHLYLMELDEKLAPKGEARRLTQGNRLAGHPVWTTDGREIVFAWGYWGSLGLWRVPARGLVAPQSLTGFEEGVYYPTLARRKNRLVYVRQTLNPDIWRVEADGPGGKVGRPVRLIASTRYEAFPQYSPDGKQIVFESQRSGTPELWICDSDGGNARQLTTAGEPHVGAPWWSPDGRQVVYNIFSTSAADIYVISAQGGRPRQLTSHPAADHVPSWSRHGHWIYFASNRGGREEMWKIPADGGQEVQVTRDGGYFGIESPDGKSLYYAKTGGSPTSLWRVPVEGGQESQVLESLYSWAAFAVVDEGIYYMCAADASGRFALEFHRFVTGKITPVTVLEGQFWPGLSASPDGRQILYTQIDQWETDLMLVEGFR